MRIIISSIVLLFIITNIYCINDDIQYCNQLREEALNRLISKTLLEMNTPEDLFRFIEAEIRLRQFCMLDDVLIPHKWNYSSRLLINNWAPEKQHCGVIALKLEDLGFHLTDFKNVLCGMNLEVRDEID